MNLAKADYYEILGINKDASESDIKSAFRKAAKRYHPDLHPGDAEAEKKFKERHLLNLKKVIYILSLKMVNGL